VNAQPLVIYNPAAGRGRAAGLVKKLRKRLPPRAELVQSRGPGDGMALTLNAIASGARWILAAGGDGTVHEVANGILRSEVRDVLFTPLPFGSMNDYAYTLGLGEWWRRDGSWESLQTLAVDVGVIRGGGREEYFVNGCGLGFNGMVTIEARRIRWLRGVPLYALGVIKALIKHFSTPRLKISFDGTAAETPTLALSIGLGQREGGFPLTPFAKLDDGLFDTLQVGDIGRWELIRHLPGMITGRLPRDHPKLWFAQSRSLSIVAPQALCVHLDGEFFCTPEEMVREFTIELMPRCLNVTVHTPALYGGDRFATASSPGQAR